MLFNFTILKLNCSLKMINIFTNSDHYERTEYSWWKHVQSSHSNNIMRWDKLNKTYFFIFSIHLNFFFLSFLSFSLSLWCMIFYQITWQTYSSFDENWWTFSFTQSYRLTKQLNLHHHLYQHEMGDYLDSIDSESFLENRLVHDSRSVR